MKKMCEVSKYLRPTWQYLASCSRIALVRGSIQVVVFLCSLIVTTTEQKDTQMVYDEPKEHKNKTKQKSYLTKYFLPLLA